MSFDDEVVASLALNALNGIGPSVVRELLAVYSNAVAALEAGPERWKAVVTHLFDGDQARADLGPAVGRSRADAESAERYGARIYLAHTGPYPSLLRQSSCPPPVLYVAGEDIAADRLCVAIVGSRACTHYGEKMARRLAEDLVSVGAVTVSGLARGIDTRVHEATLAAGGKTWAVVGSGLLMTYPPENRGLAERIRGQGAVVSEFPMATKPHPAHFPRRNRIIAGLSAGTVVVEGGESSGALITARLAAEEGRDVFAVPGPALSPQSRAPHRLLKDGATLVESAEDVLQELGWAKSIPYIERSAPDAPAPARVIFDALTDVPIDREELLARVTIDAKSAATFLVQLEMQGLIRSLPGGKLVRT